MTIRKKLGRVTSNPLVLIASCFLIIGVMAWLAIAQETDSDNDGMYDNYEVFFGLDTNNAADASDNYDSDSLTNYDESVIWTDPNEGDTDRDGFSDGEDSNATSRVFIQWGAPFFTFGDAYDYTGPEWWLASHKSGGDWLTNAPFGWQGSPVVSKDGMQWIPGGANNVDDPDFGSYCLVVSNFYMDQTEITRWEWQNVRSWAITHGYSDLPVGYGKAYNHPVYSNNWYDCVKWCNARSEMQGYTPAYYTTSSKTAVYRTGEIDLEDDCVNWYGGYRLPTDAEWEYAGRGGWHALRFPWANTIRHSKANYFSSTDYSTYDTSPTRGHHPSYDTAPIPYTSPVASFEAHGYGDGLYDMVGNLAEWTWSWFDASRRIERGGHWNGKANLCRLGGKIAKYPSDSLNFVGFRAILCKNQREELIIEVDRALLTNNVVFSMDFLDRTNSSLYISLANTNHAWVATNLYGNLITGSGSVTNFTGDIPFTNYPDAAEIHIWCDLGVATVYTNRLYIDQDHDGLDQDMELQYATSDTNTDSDGDSLADDEEIFSHGTDPSDAYTDYDSLTDGDEVNTFETDPMDMDTDHDGLVDGASEVVTVYLYPAGVADPLNPGYVIGEQAQSTSATNCDTDADGLVDGCDGIVATNTYAALFSNRKWVDVNTNGFVDGELDYGTCPTNCDTDADGLVDGRDGIVTTNTYAALFSNCPWVDTNANGFVDGELDYGTSPTNSDTDGDGLDDGEDVRQGTSPLFFDSDGDGLADGPDGLVPVSAYPIGVDADNDGFIDSDASPGVADSDGDGVNDGDELRGGSDPADPDSTQTPSASTYMAINVSLEDMHHDDDAWELMLEGNPFLSNASDVKLVYTRTLYVQSGKSVHFTIRRIQLHQYPGDEYVIGFGVLNALSNTAWVASPDNSPLWAELPGEVPDPSGAHWTFTAKPIVTVTKGSSESTFGDPINLTSGANLLGETDIAVPCPGIDLSFRRIYNNRLGGVACGLGGGWTHSLNWRVLTYSGVVYRGVSAGSWKVVSAGDDNLHWFQGANNAWKSPFDSNWKLDNLADGYRLTLPGGAFCRFDTNGFATVISNAMGRSLTFIYNGNGLTQQLARVQHDNGQYLALSYSNANLVGVSTPASNLSMRYQWNASTNMVGAIRVTSDGEFVTTYAYGQDLISITQRVNRAGDVFEYRYSYFTNGAGEVESLATGMSVGTNRYYETHMVYGVNGTNRAGFVNGEITNFWENVDDATTLLTREQRSPGGLITEMFYDSASNKSKTVFHAPDGSLFVVTSRYDSAHRLLGVKAGMQASPSNETTFGWNTTWDLPEWIQDPIGAKVEFTYKNGSLSRERVYGDGSARFDTLYAYGTNGLLTAVTNANGHGVRFSYDGWGNLNRVEPAAGPWLAFTNNRLGIVEAILTQDGRTTTFDVNDLGWVKGVTWPDGLQEHYGFDPLGNVTSHVDRAGRTMQIEWLPTGKPAAAIRYLNGSSVFVRTTYDQQFNTLNMVDELGRAVESYKLDADSRAISVTNLEGQTLSLAYTVGDRLAWMTRFDGSMVSNRYEENGWLAETVYPDSSKNFTYLGNGLLKTAENETGLVSNRYDVANRLIASTGPEPGGEVSYGYLPAGQVSNVAHIGGSTRAEYDQADRLAALQAGVQRFAFTYNTNNGLLDAVTCTNTGVSANNGHNSMDWMTNVVWTGTGGIFRSFAYGLNAVGMITNIVRENGERVRYTLDELDRLVGEEVRDVSDQVLYAATYDFDLAGNRTRTVIDGVTSDYTMGQGNRLAMFGTEGWVWYNDAGCVTTLVYSATQRLDLAWNGRSEITATATNGVACERFGYDALGRQSWTWDGVATNWHVYDGAQAVADVDATGGLIRTYVWGPGIDNLMSMTVHTGVTAVTYYAIKDHLGSVQALVNGSGVVAESYRFDAWGRVLGVYDAAGVAISESQVGNRYLWQGREYSWKIGLYYFRARWYDPVTGRWLSNDPIGISGGLNQYVFCANNPVNTIDPFGLAYIADRPLDTSAPVRALVSVSYYPFHRQIFFEDGKEPSNLGLFDDDKVRPDKSKKFDQYQRNISGFDDALMRKAVEETKAKYGTDWTKHYNCQDFVDKVIEQYRKGRKLQVPDPLHTDHQPKNSESKK